MISRLMPAACKSFRLYFIIFAFCEAGREPYEHHHKDILYPKLNTAMDCGESCLQKLDRMQGSGESTSYVHCGTCEITQSPPGLSAPS